MRRNVSGQVVGAQMVSASDGSAFTGTVSVSVTVDGGTQGAGAGTGPTHEGNGFHSYLPTQGETNGAHVAFTFTGTGAIPVTIQVYTTAYDANGRVDVGAVAGTTQTARDLGGQLDASVSSRSSHAAADIWSVATRLLTAGTNIVLAKGTGVTGFNDLDAAGIRGAVGMAAADLDTQLDALPTAAENRTEMDTNSTKLTDIVADTNELQTDDVPGLIAALNDLTAAEVNAEVVDALNTDTYAEPGQGAPPATTTLVQKIGYLYKLARNKLEQTSSQLSVYDDAGTTVDQKATVSDVGGTFTRGELETGP